MSRNSSTSASLILIVLITSCTRTIICQTTEAPDWCPDDYQHVKALDGDNKRCIRIIKDGGNLTKTLNKCGYEAAIHFEPRDNRTLEALKQYARDNNLVYRNLWIGAKRINGQWEWMSDNKSVPDFIIPSDHQPNEPCYFKNEPDECCLSLGENVTEVGPCRQNSFYPICTLEMKGLVCVSALKETIATTLSSNPPNLVALEQQIELLQQVLHDYDPSRKVEAALTLASISIVFQCLTIAGVVGYIYLKKKGKCERTAYFSHHNKGRNQMEKEGNKSPKVVPTSACGCFKC